MTQTIATVDTKAFVDYLMTILNGKFNTMYVEGYCAGYQTATGHIVWIDTVADEWEITIYEDADLETIVYRAHCLRRV